MFIPPAEMDGRYALTAVAHCAFTALALKFVAFIFPACVACFQSFISGFVPWAIFTYFTFELARKIFLSDKVSVENKAVLITGCDTGFGHLLAKRLDSKGYRVFAGCLFPSGEGSAKLTASCSSRLLIVDLDVTKNDSVRSAFQQVQDNLGSCDLWAVVNNAGILLGATADLSSISDYEKTLNVNCVGKIRVTKTFLPLLRKSKGRVVNITSGLGHVAIPMTSPYITSKFAAAGFSECLRHELREWGIKLVTVEPELFNTNLTSKSRIEASMEDSFSSLDPDTRAHYKEEDLRAVLENKDWLLYFGCSNLDVVIDDMESAVTLVHPDGRYKPRRNCFYRFIFFFYEAVPFRWQVLILHVITTVLFKKKKSR